MNFIRRIVFFFRKNGLRSTIHRSWTAVQRIRHFGKMCLYECSLPMIEPGLDGGVIVERVVDGALAEEDRVRLLDSWDPDAKARQMADRFAAGSELWLARLNGILAGYGWTLQGRTVEPYFFPLQQQDVHLYDFFVYPEFRGQGVNIALVNRILCALDGGTVRRALIECAAWNASQLRSLAKTRFHFYAVASKWDFLGRTLVFWHSRRGIV